jgi:hypothetical protein
MSGKDLLRDWYRVALTLGLCAAAFVFNARAWRLGYADPGKGFLPFLMGNFFLLALTWLSVFTAFRSERPIAPPSGMQLGDVIVLVLTAPGCLGCYPLWPAVLLVMLLVRVGVVVHGRATLGPGWRLIALRAGIVSVLFLLTWYECATTRRQALRGFAARLEDRAREGQLLDWAAEVIEARKKEVLQGQPPGRPPPPVEAPDFVHELVGGSPEQTRVQVHVEAGDPYVSVYTSVQESFQITLRPSRAAHELGPPARWLGGEMAGIEWRPGIYLDLAGNFR